MALDYSKLRNLTARQIIAALLHDGFQVRRQRGSHQRYVHADGRRVTVTYHRSSDTFEIKTVRSMLEGQAHWTEADLKRLKLIS